MAATEPSADVAEVAKRFGVTRAGLVRHMARHPRAEFAATVAAGAPSPSHFAATESGAWRAPPPAVSNAPDSPETVFEEPPATSRSEEIRAGRASSVTARGKLERLLDTMQKLADEASVQPAEERLVTLRAMSAMRALVTPIRLLMQAQGELGASDAAVLASPLVQRLLGDILEALAPFPEALRAVHAKIDPARRTEAA